MLYFAEIHLHYVYSQMLVKDRFFNIIWTSVIVHIILLTLLLQKSELLKTKEDNESLHKMIEGMRCIFILTVQSLVTHNLRGLSYTAKYYDWVWTILLTLLESTLMILWSFLLMLLVWFKLMEKSLVPFFHLAKINNLKMNRTETGNTGVT